MRRSMDACTMESTLELTTARRAIDDYPGMKGTGRWTIQEAAERSTAAPTMAAALDARYMSGRKAERVAASKTLSGPPGIPKVPKEQLVEDMKAALYCSKICSYAQVHTAFFMHTTLLLRGSG